MKLILVRHGESVWNLENKFTGWTDVGLSEKGIKEAQRAGKILKYNKLNIDTAYTSVLKRSKDTLKYMLDELNISDLKIEESYKLNERHYGALQGLNKEDTVKKYGEGQVKLWRRSFREKPPLLDKTDSRYPGSDELYKNINDKYMPLGESLYDTSKRVVEYFNDKILNDLKQGKNILIVAHGNSLRALIKYLLNLTEEEIVDFEIETGKVMCFDINEDLNVYKHYYLKGKEL